MNELRIFIFMILKIKKNDSVFRDINIPCHILHGGTQKVNYDQIRDAALKLTSKSYEVEKVSKTGKRHFESYPLMAYCKYNEGEGSVLARFNDHIKPYLLDLTQNFTTAQFKQFMNINSFFSWRMYWFLKQYEDFGYRTMEVDEIKLLLNIEDKYERFSDFKRKVLSVCQKDLRKTDMTFDYEVIRKGKKAEKIKFILTRNKPYIPQLEARKKNISSSSGQASFDFDTNVELVSDNVDFIRKTLAKTDLSRNEQKKVMALMQEDEIVKRLNHAIKNKNLLKIAPYFKEVL